MGRLLLGQRKERQHEEKEEQNDEDRLPAAIPVWVVWPVAPAFRVGNWSVNAILWPSFFSVGDKGMPLPDIVVKGHQLRLH